MADSSTFRELRELEHVNIVLSGPGTGLGCLGIIVAVVLGFTHYFIEAASLLGLALLVEVITWKQAETSASGITYRRSLWRTRIAWLDVIQVSNHPVDIGKQVGRDIKISSDNQTILLHKVCYPEIEASIWQHLRKYGKSGGFAISDLALSYWADIPEDVPREMDYREDSPKENGGPVVYKLREDYISEEWVGATDEILKNAKKKENPLVISWEEVCHVEYDQWGGDYDSVYLTVETADGRSIHIRDSFQMDNYYGEPQIDNARFLLAVIRRAREQGFEPLVVLSKDLREALGVTLPSV